MKSIIFSIGRNKAYPYICILLVTLAFLYTNPFENHSWRYVMSYFGAMSGLLCVILLAKGKNSGNILGLFAAVGESSGNYLGGNIGAALPSIYYAVTHVFGFFSWRKHKGADDSVVIRLMQEKHFFLTILFLIVATFFNVYLTGVLNVDNDPYQLICNSFIFALGVVAQFLLMQRYSFNWFLWIVLNVLVIGLNIYTNNPIIAVQYLIYLFNSTYALFEWSDSVAKQKEDGVLVE